MHRIIKHGIPHQNLHNNMNHPQQILDFELLLHFSISIDKMSFIHLFYCKFFTANIGFMVENFSNHSSPERMRKLHIFLSHYSK